MLIQCGSCYCYMRLQTNPGRRRLVSGWLFEPIWFEEDAAPVQVENTIKKLENNYNAED